MIAKQVQKIADKDEMNSLEQLKLILLYLFPQNRRELFLFLGLMTAYFSYSLFFLLNSNVVDHPHQLADMLFNFDNAYYIHNGDTAVDVHPLLRFILFPMQFVAMVLSMIGSYKWFGGAMVFFFSGIIAMGVVYVYRYLKEIVAIGSYSLWILTFMYASFFTNMLLCFLVESYSLSIYFLAFSIFFYSLCVKANRRVKASSLFFFTFVAGGITITNGLKGIIPYLFTKGTMGVKLKKSIVVGILFLISMVGLIYFHFGDSFLTVLEKRLSYVNIEDTRSVAHYEKVIDHFLGSPVLSATVITRSYFDLNDKMFEGMTIEQIAHSVYHSLWQYLWLGMLYLCVVVGIARNYKNKLVHMLLAVWIVDLFIHLVAGYGINEGFIYGGHWVFLIPMFLGWGYKSMEGVWKNVYLATVFMLFITMLGNNLYQLYQTYLYAIEIFPHCISNNDVSYSKKILSFAPSKIISILR